MTLFRTRPSRVRAGLAAACALGTLGVGGMSLAADPTEYKKPTRNGTVKSDRIVGTNKRDVIYAQDGNDRVRARAGNDTVYGGSGRDRLEGNSGKDVLEGGSSNDTLIGNGGADDLDGGSGNDRIEARDGVRDVVYCGSGTDTVIADRKDRILDDCERVSRR